MTAAAGCPSAACCACEIARVGALPAIISSQLT